MNNSAADQDRVGSRRIKGIAAAPGLASGEAYIWRKFTLQVPRYATNSPSGEVDRLNLATGQARQEIMQIQARVAREAGESEAAVFEAHAMFLDDPALLELTLEAIGGGLNAEAAWMGAIEHYAQELEQIDDETLRARAVDVRDVGQRVVRRLMNITETPTPHLDAPVILVARDLEPSQTASLDKSLVLAFCTAEGGPTSHTAILAKSMGLPAVVGLGEEILSLASGTALLVDGATGMIIVEPTPSEIESFMLASQTARQEAEAELAQAHQPARTTDGKTIEIAANIGSPEDAQRAVDLGAEGVGLLRTEFLYLDRETPPSEDEQFEIYRQILDRMGERPVVVRTLDVGGDKPPRYMDLGQEANPFLGWRAIRVCLENPEFFKVQLRALLRASLGHHLRIMFPMIAVTDEVRQARRLLDLARQELAGQGAELANDIQVGIMVEIPSVAWMADQFAGLVDFFSIGTNDLTQYTFAAERTNEKVAHLNDAIHPAILREVKSVVEAGHKAGIWTGICGELAGDPNAVPILLGLEVDELSMAPASIPHAKAIVRRWSKADAARLANEALNLDSAASVRALVKNA